MRIHTALPLAFLLIVLAAPVTGQDRVPAEGDVVRVTHRLEGPALVTSRVTGAYAGLADERLRLNLDDGRTRDFALSEIVYLEIRGEHSPGVGAGKGALYGGLAGVFVGLLGSNIEGEGIGPAFPSVLVVVGVGAGIGALVGVLTGGREWDEARLPETGQGEPATP